METTTYDRTRDQLIALSDAELAVRFGDLAGEVFAVDDVLGDRLFALLAETFERFAPEAARALIVHYWSDDDADALLDAFEDMRRREASRAVRDVFARWENES